MPPGDGGVLALVDTGGNLPITAVTHTQTAMNVLPGTGEQSYAPLLAKVMKDTRVFPSTLLEQHKKAARVKGAGFMM